MSRLTDLLRQARQIDHQMGVDLEAEFRALSKRRTFGLVYERHQPEAVELPGRAVRRGDKVRVLPSRGETKKGDQRLWRVSRLEGIRGSRAAHLLEHGVEEPEARSASLADVVVVAEFRDTIFPGLVETGRVERGGARPFHTVINAENYHALELLTYTHRHGVDAIYIDPPYNTGAKDWKYNNDYVEADDDYRHSKWLAMMERRLRIARELLKPDDSVLIVTIDEKEVHRLGLLLEQVFPEAAIQMVSSVINPAGAGRSSEFSRTDEYLFFVRIGSSRVLPEQRNEEKKGVVWDTLRRSDFASRRGTKKGGIGQFYPFYVDPKKHRIEAIGEPLPHDIPREQAPVRPGCVAVFPVRPDGTEMNWGITVPTARERLAQGYVRLGRAKPKEPQQFVISYLTGGIISDIESGNVAVSGHAKDGSVVAHYITGRVVMPTTNWNKTSHDAQRSGTAVLRALMPDRRFPFPKSLYAVEDSLRHFLLEKRDALILDFFAGSGTTAHAVMRLNRQDGGHRQCISVTNNEVADEEQRRLRKKRLRPGDREWEKWGICDYVTKPRIEAAITGLTSKGEPIKGDYKYTDEFPLSDGLEENAAFFTLTYEGPLSVAHHRAFSRIAPMLWMRAGSQGRIIVDVGTKGWDIAETYGVLVNLDQARMFVKRIAQIEGVRLAFLVTDDDSAFQMVCRDLPARVRPVRLYESYLQNFRINSGRVD